MENQEITITGCRNLIGMEIRISLRDYIEFPKRIKEIEEKIKKGVTKKQREYLMAAIKDARKEFSYAKDYLFDSECLESWMEDYNLPTMLGFTIDYVRRQAIKGVYNVKRKTDISHNTSYSEYML